jgi:hypothetical protein
MRKRNTSVFGLVVAGLCIAAYAGALVIGGYRLYENVEGRKAAAEREFYDLVDLAAAAGVLGFMDAAFQDTVRDGLVQSQTLEGVIISGPAGEYAFERERGAVVRWEGDSPRFAQRLGVSTTAVVPLRIAGLRNVNISAGFSAVDYDHGVDILKNSLILILAALATAFLTLLIDSAVNKKRAAAGGGRDARARRVAAAAVDEYPDFAPEPDTDGPADAAESGEYPDFAPEPDTDGLADAAESEEYPDFAPEPDTDGLADAAGSGEYPDFTPEPDTDGLAGDLPGEFAFEEGDMAGESYAGHEDLADTPRGLYSPRSGVGWEDYAQERLEAELHRCASHEQDLVLAAAAFADTDGTDDAQYRQFAETAVDFFGARDLVFENGARGITVILPNTGLDAGLARTEEFRRRLAAEFGGGAAFRAGISARSGRLVDAERLAFEAGEALNKARADPAAAVIAFKSDPEKYRAFLRSRA